MARRIEIELTSARPDGTWTWRAAGAREPKGVVNGGLLHEGARAGDVLRADAEFELEGIVIVSVLPPKTDKKAEAARIEVVGSGRTDVPGVTTSLVGRADRRPGERRREREGERGPGGPRRPSLAGSDRRRAQTTDRGPRQPRREERAGSQEPSLSEDRPPRQPRNEAERRRAERPEGEERAARGRHSPAAHGEGGPARGRPAPAGERSRARRLTPGSAHRRALMESLPPEHQPIAEQLLRGGIPAVRTALHLERERAQAEGRPVPNSDELVALAETLLPRVRAAEWRDRAEAVAADPQGVALRDLRSAVAGADLARDEEGRSLGARLREALEARTVKLHADWAAEITSHLDAGRVVRALRLSARPPEPSARLDAALATRLAQAAGAAMTSDTPADVWMALLEAAVESPVRRSVQPAALPSDPPAELKRAAHQMSGTVPALAKLLGIALPPPPAPLPRRGAGPERDRPRRPPRPAGANPVPVGEQGPASAEGGQVESPPEENQSPAPGEGRQVERSEPDGSEGAGPLESQAAPLTEGRQVETSEQDGPGAVGSGSDESGGDSVS